MMKTSFFLGLCVLCLCFFSLTSCNNKSAQDEFLLKTWKLNDAKEGKQALFASKEGTTFRFMKNNKLEIKRRYRGKTTYLRGTFQMKGKKMSLHLLEYENKRVVYDLGSKETSEEHLIAEKEINQQINLNIEKLEKFVLKLQNDSLQYILVPDF